MAYVTDKYELPLSLSLLAQSTSKQNIPCEVPLSLSLLSQSTSKQNIPCEHSTKVSLHHKIRANENPNALHVVWWRERKISHTRHNHTQTTYLHTRTHILKMC